MSAIATTLTESPAAVSVPKSATAVLSTRERVVIGGLGALTPILLNLLVVDLNTTFTTFTVIVFLGYCIRVVGFFTFGGLVAYLHRDETSLLKLFELGIVAPALLTGVINGAKIKESGSLRAAAPAAASTASVADFFIPTAYAQAPEGDVKQYSRRKESITSQFWRGLSGSQSEDVWHVVAGTYGINELREARQLARNINYKSKEFNAEIYKNDKYYAVVIGANLTADEAKALKQKASEAGIPTKGDIYLYNPWASE